ncbi:MAG TPA: hypothetical protein VF188_11700 [Longimicrobiales bacterium]
MIRHDKPSRPTVLAALALLLAAAPRAPAQDRRVLDDLSAGSTVSTHSVVQLSFVGLDVAPDVAAHIFRLPGGGWGVSSRVFPGVVQLFDTAGVPAGKFGRSGHGPGELGGEILAVAMRGELWVVDRRNARLSIFTEDLRFAGDRPFHGLGAGLPAFIAPAHDGKSVLVSGSVATADMHYAVARVLREPGADVFGDSLGRLPLAVSQWLVQRRGAAETAGGEVWAVAMAGGAIDVLRSRDLSPVARLQLPGSEMAREARWRGTDLDERPAPRLAGIAADSAGLIWVSFAVADSAWTPGTDPRESLEQVFATRVLAIDPEKRAVVGKVQLDPVCMSVERNLISCVDEVGQTIRVIALHLEPRRRSE